MIKLCIFDLDGTLIDSLEDLANSTNYALHQHNFPTHPISNYRHFVGDGIRVLLERTLASQTYTATQYEATLATFQTHYNDNFLVCTHPYEDITTLLNELTAKGIQVAVVTNKPHLFATQIIASLFPNQSFLFVQGNSDTFPKKPDPTVIFHYLQEHNISPSECIYIGDSDVDIYTGKNAGMPAIGVTWGFRGRDELVTAGADFVIDTPLELLSLELL